MSAALLRCEMFGGSVKTAWRPFINWEHGTLCRQFGLDPVRFYFDLPSTIRTEGANRVGAGRHAGGIISGYVMQIGQDEPVGKIIVAREGERFRDVDPMDRREFQRLDR